MPCVIPKKIPHGRYDVDYKENMTIMYGSLVEYSCDSGWRKAVPEVTCLIGGLRPTIPECIPNPVVSNITIAPINVKRSEPLTSIKVKAKKSTESPHGKRS